MEVQQAPLAELGDWAVLLQLEALKLLLEPWRCPLADGFLGDDLVWRGHVCWIWDAVSVNFPTQVRSN